MTRTRPVVLAESFAVYRLVGVDLRRKMYPVLCQIDLVGSTPYGEIRGGITRRNLPK